MADDFAAYRQREARYFMHLASAKFNAASLPSLRRYFSISARE